ncbi:caspase family protein [Rhizobium sp. 32-5/1]|uniref:caspase family protein n=1 Tax=Rhizobium sp. 32-5/1 TaxID=3019602 RepID=UPI00240CF2F3|nr:caspase family protein [Rhizobium sp. 32-5/1]WEZ83603.1 caspase family protein [Rhizobium sp. 32-5/1]
MMDKLGIVWRRILPASLLLAAVASPLQAADRALLIGIGTYESLPPEMFLHGPKNDVVAMQDLLTKNLDFAPDSIRILKDTEATRDAILSSINDWLIKDTKDGDRIYLYFSGHGLQVKDLSKDEEDGMDEALATYNIKAVDTDWSNVILDDDIEPLLEKMKGRVVTLVIDACHSGTISRSLSVDVAAGIDGARFLPRPFAKPVQKALTRGLRIDTGVVDKPAIVKESGVTTWSAAAPYQVAWDDVRLPEDKRHGVFTSAYIAGYKPPVADGNANGLVSNAELFEYVKAQSDTYCKSQKNCENLDPQLETVNAKLGASVAKPEPAADYVEAAPEKKKEEVKYEEVKVDVVAAAPAYVDADPVSAVGDIVGKADNGDVTISLDHGPKMKKGDVFKISVTSKHDGNLILLDVNKEGVATQFFPNEFAQKITPLKAGSTLTMPDDYYGFDFEADGSGESIMVAIVVSDDIDLKAVAPYSRGLKVELNARETLSDIVARLQKTWTGDLENRGIKWSMATMKYTID